MVERSALSLSPPALLQCYFIQNSLDIGPFVNVLGLEVHWWCWCQTFGNALKSSCSRQEHSSSLSTERTKAKVVAAQELRKRATNFFPAFFSFLNTSEVKPCLTSKMQLSKEKNSKQTLTSFLAYLGLPSDWKDQILPLASSFIYKQVLVCAQCTKKLQPIYRHLFNKLLLPFEDSLSLPF